MTLRHKTVGRLAARRATVRLAAVAVALVVAVTAVACSSDGGGSATEPTDDPAGTTVRVVTHDSFDVSPEVLAGFEAATGITVELLSGGDAVSVVNQAILSVGNPVADVLFGIDNTQLAAAFAAGLFTAYEPADATALRDDVGVDVQWRVTPIDVGDVCVNYDRAYFDAAGLAPPASLADLADPAYAGLLVVQNPATSSPGLAFLAATVAAYGDGPDAPGGGYAAYWQALADNGVEVADGWEQAYYGRFSGGSGEGDRPLVVSYATSPPAEVFYADGFDADNPATWPADAPTGVATGTCWRQVEYAGILSGATNPAAARAVIDFLVSESFQADVPLRMFVQPARAGVAVPEVFTRYAVEPGTVWSLDADVVANGRDDWVRTWRQVVVG
jgi:thiamine transport system substrate-binding protein